MYHKITIVGNLGRDPELRYTSSGQAVCSYNVATNRTWTNSDGSRGEETVWFRISSWGKRAEIDNQYLRKGSSVLIEGRMNVDRDSGGPRVWQDQSGNHRASYEVTAEVVKFIGGRNDGGGGGGNDDYYGGGGGSGGDGGNQGSRGGGAPRQQPSQNRINEDPNPVTEDEIPF